ncbi:hypothetical protein CH63R_09785 [Colletotrichum higginsianum IMI 349063]|uniref:Uncharacterized protein n=1 Tax=Colletotrichum higginsianum (strain IMI 349063) TaxID=759273 RepID=A0A1B7Y0Y3_COLHI|nr:uncharacterized protein CH63R_09785 [Colletotrichum higginsianum IMI 349063]OBR05665.1 hypothetical protein CH63R_09785 [Colletotrichum higginsianum IMI 349063]
MSNTFNIDSLPTIPSSWTAPTSCFASTLYYRVLLSGGYFSNLYGTPTPVLTGNVPTGDCFPPSFTINTPYQTDGDCPSGYTRACATAGPDRSGKPVSTVTCCPSVTGNAFSFMCKDHEYGCHGTGTVGAVWTGVITDIGIPTPTEEPVTRTPFTVEGIEAWGIKFISVAPTTVPTSTATSSLSLPTTTAPATTAPATTQASPTGSLQNDSNNSSAGLSTGAIVGIAIGAAAGNGILALVVYLLVRNKRRRQNNGNNYASTTNNQKHFSSNEPNDRYNYPVGVNDGRIHEAPLGPGQRQTWELQG